MKILSAEQIRELDRYTIENEPVASIDLMERAASKVYQLLSRVIKTSEPVYVFCGMGNNGGDGLAVARMLIESGYGHVTAYTVRHSPGTSKDFLINEDRLKNISSVHYIETENQIPAIHSDAVIIDAIFGTGLSRPVEGIAASVIHAINRSGNTVYSVDIPSGLFCDKSNAESDTVIHSAATFTFHAPKLSFLFAANGKYVPRFVVLDIGLSKDYAEQLPSSYYFVTKQFTQSFFRRREKFTHKGTYGHALIAAGSFGKTGAAILAVKAALLSGAGLVTSNIPSSGYEIMQTSNPEAMVEADKSVNFLRDIPELDKYSAVGVGPGIGTETETREYLEKLLAACSKPLVMDADALNIISANEKLLALVPENSILTPHPGEFKRLTGEWSDDSDKLERQKAFSKKHKVILVLKGAHTSVSTPGGKMYFNSSGNAGMAKGGSGDVLTGVITSLLAQHYTPEQAAILGVFVHGLAGDFARDESGETSMNASDIIHHLPKAFQELESGASE